MPDKSSEVIDPARLRALRAYEILGTPPEAGFDDIVLLAAQICETPVSLVSFVADNRQWFKARLGFEACETSLEQSVCAETLGTSEVLVIPDLTLDARTQGNGLVTREPHIRFYAGAPLVTPEGQSLGALCVIDRRPRPEGLTENQRLALEALARQVMNQLAMRRAVAERDDALRRRHAEQVRHRQIVDSAQSYAILSLDLAGDITSWNTGAEKILGWPAQEICGQPVATLFTPEDVSADVPAREMKKASETGHGNDERFHLRKDGSRFWASGQMMPLKDEHDLHVGYVKILTDRSQARDLERKLAETRANRASLARVVEQSLDFVGITNPQGRLVYVNRAGLRLMGMPELHTPGNIPLIDYFAAHERPRAREEIMATCLKAGRWVGESVFQREDGQEVPVLLDLFSVRNDLGEVIALATIIRDLTEAKHTAAKLQQFALRLEQQVEERTRERDDLWNLSPDLFVSLDAAGRYLRLNPASRDILGIDAASLHAGLFIDDVHAEDIKAVEAAFDGASRGLFGRDADVRLRHADGSYRLLSLKAVRSKTGLYGIGREVTEQRQLAEQLRQSQKMEAVGQLTGGMAHDFNNMLAGITGSLELIQTRLLQGRHHDLERFITAAQGSAKRAAALTHRLLAFSRRQTLEPKPIDMNRLVAGMADLVRRTVGPAVTLETVAGGDLWTTLVDESQLESALLNLCINARDAMPGGGKIVIETHNRWIDEIAARTRDLAPGEYATLCVSDQGTGMTPEVIARAFDPFFTTKPLGQGTGLGLSMIYGFVTQSGGHVRIYSEIDQGTTVCMYLPRYLGKGEEASLETDTVTRRALAGETVLVVDDEPTVRMLVTEVLEDLGYAAIEASDGASGLKILQSNVRIDLMVTDVGLPGGMNGRQVADAARVARPKLKVLFITGYAENALLSHGRLEAGMASLTKPFAMDALAMKIREMIESQPS